MTWWRTNWAWRNAGTLGTLSMLALLVSGVYLLTVYRVSVNPYSNVTATLDQNFLGRIMRSFHRYAADALLLFTILHAVREAAAGRYHGRARLSWMTGVWATVVILVIGVLGYILPWDRLAHFLLASLTRLFDGWPIFVEPPSRVLLPELITPWLFFFAYLGHIMLTLWLVVLLVVHVIRFPRLRLWPERGLSYAFLAALLGLSITFPVTSQGPVEPGVIPKTLLIDRFYLFWLPWVEHVSPALATGAFVGIVTILTLVPFLIRRRSPDARHPTSSDSVTAGEEE